MFKIYTKTFYDPEMTVIWKNGHDKNYSYRYPVVILQGQTITE